MTKSNTSFLSSVLFQLFLFVLLISVKPVKRYDIGPFSICLGSSSNYERTQIENGTSLVSISIGEKNILRNCLNFFAVLGKQSQDNHI